MNTSRSMNAAISVHRQQHPYRLLPPKNVYIQRGGLLYALLLLTLHSLHFILVYPSLESPGYSLIAWALLLIGTVFTAVMVLMRSGRASAWTLIVSYLFVILTIGYDMRGSWFGTSFLEQLTAAYAVSAIILMIMLTVNYHLAVVTIASYGLSIMVMTQLHQPQALINQARNSAIFIFSIATLIIVFMLVEKYRQILDNQLNRIHSSGNFAAPRLALGKEFGDEIVKLDTAAEELLSRV
ncbi:MAG: hypothetical protein WBA28_08185, partial [Microbacteriaceae bacterium]